MVAAFLGSRAGAVVFLPFYLPGRAGSALTAEIGLMKATEQLSGMEMMELIRLSALLLHVFLAD